MPVLTLTTDFGLADYYVAAVKGTVLRLAGDAAVRLVDLSHELPPGDVEAAADFLAGAVPTFPAGTVHLAVVDPGVGSDRRILVVEAGRGQLLVGPDNGLFTAFLAPDEDDERSGRAFAVERDDLFLDSPGATFHGRDRFAPVAAALLGGATPAELGAPIDDPVRLERPAPVRRSGGDGAPEVLEGRVVRVDRFGNLVTDLPASWLGGAQEGAVEAQVEGRSARRLAGHYAELPAGEPALLVGSLGTLELSLRDASLARRWRVGRGARVRVLLRSATGL